MIVLLDTSTTVCKVAVIHEEERHDFTWEAGRALAKGLLRFIQEKAGDIHEIQGIGVMKGPGSFTGLRIGLTVANTLADSLHVPIVGAQGHDWQDQALRRIRAGGDERIVMPEYGAEAHITQPRK